MSASLPALPPAAELLPALLDLSVAGVVYYLPVRDAAGEVTDLTFAYLNPAAQRLLELPARPVATYRQVFAGSADDGSWAFHQGALLAADQAEHPRQGYQTDRAGNLYLVAARPLGEGLLVSFTAATEQALRDSETQVQAARSDAEAQRQRLHQVLLRTPANVALLRGPEHVYTFANPEYERLFPGRRLLGRPIREVIPEIEGQGFYELFDRVYQTGEPFYAPEAEAWADFAGTGTPQRRYYRTTFEPIRDAEGRVVEVLNFAVDVTDQVEARQQVEQLNHELESRVQERTGQLEAAQATTERQRRQWEELFERAPAAICIFGGPEWVYEFVNPNYQALFPGRQLLGRTLLEALPELAGQPLLDTLRHVYNTGEPYEASGELVALARTEGGPVEDIYFNLTYQARHDDLGRIDGLITYSYDVTEQVLAHRQAATLQAALLANAQRQVQRREELYQVFEQAPAAIVLLREPDHRIEYANPAYQQLFPGVSLRGRLIGDALPAAAANVARLDAVFSTGTPYVGEEEPLELTLTPGQPAQTRYFNYTIQPYREEGNIVGVTVFAYDVTEAVLARRAAAEEQAQQQQAIQHVFEQAPVAIFVLRGPQYVMDTVNPAMSEMLGRPAAGLQGRPFFEAVPELADQGYAELLAQVWRTGQAVVMQENPAHLAHHQPGETSYFNFVYQPLYEGGQLTAIICVAVEVTEQVLARQRTEQLNQELETRVAERTREVQEAQAAAERGQSLLQALLAQAPVAISLFQGEELRVATANARMAALWGYAPEQVLGRPLLEGVPELRGQGFDDLLRQVLATRTPHVGTEVPATMRRDGELTTTYYDFVYQPLYNAGGEVLGVINVATEVTEQVEARRRIEQLVQEAEAARAEAERQRAQLQALLSQAPVAIALFQGPDTRIASANERMAALWGRTPAQVVGRPLLEAVPELQGQGFDEMIQGVRTSGVPFVGTEAPATILRDGELVMRYYDFSCQPIYDDRQELLGVLNVGTEVTEQVEARRRIEQLNQEAEAARAEAERQRGELERVFEQAPVAIAVYRGPNYIIQLANPTVARLWGRTREQLIGKGLFEALPEVAGMGYEQLLDNVMATGEPYVALAMEAKHEREGRLDTVYWDFVYVPTYAADGHIDGAMVVATEVTEQVQARHQVEQLNQDLETRVRERTRQLSEQQALLSRILGQVPASIATLSGPEHRYTFFNELYQELSADRTALGLTVAEVFPEAAAQGFIDLLDQVYATGEPFVGTDVPAQLYDARLGGARQYYVDFIYQPLFDAQRRVQGILAFILDVTDRTQARQQVHTLNQELAASVAELRSTNQELHATNARLTRTNNDLDTFVYTASHDLKAPITNIEGLLDALRDYLPAAGADPMIPQLLGMMENSVARFLRTIGQLTDVSRLQNATREPAEPVELAELVDSIRLDLAPLLASTGGQLLAEVTECPTVFFSPKNLRSILYNLLSNGLKYRAPDRLPVVRLRAACLPGRAVLTVQDNGLGLSEAQQAKLFTLFHRLHTHVEGSGVGLYMLKRIVENAEGTVAVHSEPGLGSTFTITLPQRAG